MIDIVFIPDSIQIEKNIPEKYEYLRKSKHIERMYAFVEIVCIQGMTQGKNKNLWSNLHWRLLENVLTRRHNDYRNALVDMGIILCDCSYMPGAKCMSYRIVDDCYGKYKEIHLRDNVLKKKLSNSLDYFCTSTDEVSKHMFKFIQKLQVTGIKGENLHQARSLYFIENDLFYLHRDDYGRVHTNLTGIKKKHRKEVKYNNEKLVQIDVKNSQPLLFNVLLEDLVKKNVLPDVDENLFYKYLTESGEFYDYISKAYKVSPSGNVKIRLFKNVFFGKKTVKKFKRLFPIITEAIDYYKKKDYRELSHRLQRIESDLFIDKICGRIMQDFPDIPFFTIHDCILTTADNVNYISSVIRDEFSKIGLHVSLDIG